MSKRPSLGLALIAKNEAENIERLFKSIEGCFDEIHLTDTGSTDNTVELAKQLGAKVHHFKWVDDFAAARNASFEPLTTDYIMWLDLDDELGDREKFIDFRDNVMSLAEYWLATYNYSFNAQGKPICTFGRERIVKRDRGFKWKYFLHEGILPNSQLPVRVQYATNWCVNHRRTEKDLQKDNSRNLDIFKKNVGKMDARMTYYYGKELWENQRADEAVVRLADAVVMPELETHDRTLAHQYLCYALMSKTKPEFENAIQIALQGLALAPARAEFFVIIGDCYIKLNRPIDALPYYESARSCKLPNGVQAGPIFNHLDAYGPYPLEQLARIYFFGNEVAKAKEVAQESLDKYKSEEARKILVEIENVGKKIHPITVLKHTDDIVITTPPMGPYEWDAEIARTKSMGGSETAAIEMSQWLTKLSGRKVKIYNMRNQDKTIDGVEYIDNKKVHDYFGSKKPYLHIAWRHNIKLTESPTFLWCHDLFTPGGEFHQNYTKMLCLTPFHKKYVQAIQSIPDDKILVTRNGLNPEKFKVGQVEKDPFRFVYGSSPDRGLDRAMRVLDRVRKVYPVKLHIHYGWEHLDQYGLGDLRKNLQAMYEERKDWVVYHGATQQNALMRSYAESAYNVQPSDWIETSMISAMELVCSGVYPIMRRLGGVIDTLAEPVEKGMATLVDSECITESQHDLYADEVLKAMSENRYKNVKLDPETRSWKSVAEDWLKELPKWR